jgi:hypothetical protein
MKPALLLAPLLVLACSKTSEPDPSKSAPNPPPVVATSAAPSSSISVPPLAPPPHVAIDLTWTADPSWRVQKNPNPMRKVTYLVPKVEGDPENGDLSISQAGGGTDPNIKRWGAQFEGGAQPKITTRMVGTLRVILVEDHGTYTAMSGGGETPAPKTDWALLGAIVEATTPPYFFKLTGPAKTVAAAHNAFDAMVGSFVLKK